MDESKKPLGVTLVALCSGFFGLMAVATGCVATFASQVPGASLYFTIAGLIAITAGVLLLAASYGIWTLQEWGRTVMRWLCVASIPLGIISSLPIWPGQRMTIGNAILQIVGVAVNVLIILYLMKPEVKTLFGDSNFLGPQRGTERLEPHWRKDEKQ